MKAFDLPHSTQVQKVIPKNAFDQYCNTKQKAMFTDHIARITWTHKLSKDTLNLPASDVQEIQLFTIELKVKEDISKVLEIIDKAIPYPIVFTVVFAQEYYLSVAAKHQHPLNPDNAVVDWIFTTPWATEYKYDFDLKKSIDYIYEDFCKKIAGESSQSKRPLQEVVLNHKEIAKLNNKITKLKSLLAKEPQFNRKVEINLELQKEQQHLERLESRL